MSQSAMGTIWDGEWESLSDFKLDEWLLLKDEISNKEVNDSSSKLTKCEIAEQVLHDIEDLGRTNPEYWLDEFPLFDEIQTPKFSQETESKRGQEVENFDLIFHQEQLSPKDGFVVPDVLKPSDKQDLFSVSYENTATFILSNENILCIDHEPFLSFTPLQKECEKYNQEETSFKDAGDGENITFQPGSSPNGDDVANVKREMAVVDEILQSTALELDQWESDTSRSEVSSDGTTSACLSPKEREEETDDPDWKPDSPVFSGQKRHVRRSKPYWRGGSQEEKKLRKKEQNKNAATRYRQKKKAEVHEILKEEEALKQKRAKLQERMADIQSEIKCLKALMRDLFKAKGVL